MLKPAPRDQTGHDPADSRYALQALYTESLAHGDPDITLIVQKALICCDELIAEGKIISCKSVKASLYLYFLSAITGLPPEEIGHLVALLERLGIIPAADKNAKARSGRTS